MHFLIGLGAATGLFLFANPDFSKYNQTYTKIPKSPHDVYFVGNCEWLCFKNAQKPFRVNDVSLFANSTYQLFERVVASSKKPITNINELTKSAIRLINRNQCSVEKIYDGYPLTFKQYFAEMSLWAAFYMRVSGQTTDDDLVLYLTFSFPQLLNDLSLLDIGVHNEEFLKERFDGISADLIRTVLSKLYILLPKLRFISPVIMARLFLILFSAEQHYQIKENCIRYIYSKYGDFSPLATGNMTQFYAYQFDKILTLTSEVYYEFNKV